MDRKEALDRVEASPIRQVQDKETAIHFRSKKQNFNVESYEAPVVKGLLRNDHFKLDSVTVYRNQEEHTLKSPSFQAYDKVVGVKGTLPIGCLTIKNRKKSNNHHSSIL